FPQTRDIALDQIRGARRRLVTPDLVDQTRDRDNLTAPRKQDREHGTLLEPSELDGGPVVEHLERPEDPKLKHRSTPQSAAGSPASLLLAPRVRDSLGRCSASSSFASNRSSPAG